MHGSVGFQHTALHRGVWPFNVATLVPVFLCQIRMEPSITHISIFAPHHGRKKPAVPSLPLTAKFSSAPPRALRMRNIPPFWPVYV